jgi:hypothetical protein
MQWHVPVSKPQETERFFPLQACPSSYKYLEVWIHATPDFPDFECVSLNTGFLYAQDSLVTGFTVARSHRCAGLMMYAAAQEAFCAFPLMFYTARTYVEFTVSFTY